MNTVELLQLVRALSGLVELAGSVGIDVKRLADLKAEAEAEGRDLSDDELLSLRSTAQASIDSAREV